MTRAILSLPCASDLKKAVIRGRMIRGAVWTLFLWLVWTNAMGARSLPDSVISRLIEQNRHFIKSMELGPYNYDSLIPLIDNFDEIENLRLKGDAAFLLGHYYMRVFDTETSLKYFSQARGLYKRTGNWGLYLKASKDFCNASRNAGKVDAIEPILKEGLQIARTHSVGFYVLNPIQELTVHYAFTEGRYRDAIKYGLMFKDSLAKYEAMDIVNFDFAFNSGLDAEIVELELGHSYLETGDFAKAERYLHGCEPFFIQRGDNEKLSRIYRHLALLKGREKQLDSVAFYLNKYDLHTVAFNRQRTSELFNLPTVTRELISVNEAYEKSQEEVDSLTKQNYYVIGLFLLTIIFGAFAFWWQRKSGLGQIQINKLLRRDFEREQELNEQKSKYFSILSHELRTPIFAITGLAKLLSTPAGNTRENMEAIVNSGNHLLQLVNNVLQHNKLESSENVQLDRVDFELTQTIEEVLQTTSYLAGQKNIEVVFQNELDGEQFLAGDKQKLAQILVNLISNAIRYSHRNGKVTLSISLIMSDESGNTYCFSVIDHGIGIEAGQIANLFDYRKTNHNAKNESSENLKGMGIGLFVVARFIAAMGSRVAVESNPGIGSNFYFDLTFERGKHVEPRRRALKKAVSQVNVLVVDDIMINLLVTQKTLAAVGINCITATDADPVIDIIRDKDIDIVLMDLNMPLISGYELSKNIRKAGLTLPIIAHTAVIRENIDLKALEDAEIQDFLVKPYRIEELKEKLTMYLNVDFLEVG